MFLSFFYSCQFLDQGEMCLGFYNRKVINFCKIIEPLASRCAKFRFKLLSKEIMSSRILYICKEEGLNLDSEALSNLGSISQGDLRRAITYLQLFEAIVEADDISDEQKARISKKLAEADKLLDVAGNTIRACCNMPEGFSFEG
ncbi:replication factor C subunit 2-like isoform X2 [Prosopis cineraria]|uniref:replication factor C subunit 2-like isoform X2 n=1 Tax=Prosopis cineraria TaxID=364024 RepID=UPI00240F2784|nr:replication factor C subunit 2-like isoform X2 [Prosopis cineraria]